jgi:hypothetical protein
MGLRKLRGKETDYMARGEFWDTYRNCDEWEEDERYPGDAAHAFAIGLGGLGVSDTDYIIDLYPALISVTSLQISFMGMHSVLDLRYSVRGC